MSLTLSWDLFIIVFFAIVITYSFIIGKHESIKIIVSSYIAIVTVQAVGNIFERLFGMSDAQSMLGILGLGTFDTSVTSVLKLILFITIIVFLAVRAGLHVQYQQEHTALIGALLTGCSGFATAGILLVTLLTYIAGVPLLNLHLDSAPALLEAAQQSSVLKILVENQDALFVLPAGVLIVAGILSKN